MRSDLTIGEMLELSEYETKEDKKKSIETRSKKIGDIITKLRLDTGLTQKEVSQLVGVAQTTYAGYETGRHEPSVEMLIKLADAYKVSMDYITGRYTPAEAYENGLDADYEIQEMIQTENYASLVEYREKEKRIKEEIKKRGPYNRVKKKK